MTCEYALYDTYYVPIYLYRGIRVRRRRRRRLSSSLLTVAVLHRWPSDVRRPPSSSRVVISTESVFERVCVCVCTISQYFQHRAILCHNYILPVICRHLARNGPWFTRAIGLSKSCPIASRHGWTDTQCRNRSGHHSTIWTGK